MHIEDEIPVESEESNKFLSPEMEETGGMDRREIATLICKTLALVMFAQVAFLASLALLMILLQLGAAPFQGWINWPLVYTAFILGVPTLAIGMIGIIYWRQAYAIAGRMVSPDPTPVTSFSLSTNNVMMVTFSTTGIFIFVQSLRELAAVLHWVNTDYFSNQDFWSRPETWSSGLGVLLGLWLILGSHGIVGAIHWCRTAGVRDLSDESATRGD